MKRNISMTTNTTTTIPAPDWASASAALSGAARLLMVTHVDPDGDAIGSLLGLGHALRARGKQVDLAVDHGVPSYLKFLPGSETVLEKLEAGEWDVMISLDSSDEERTGDCGIYGRAHSPLVINVDHHPSNTLFGSIHLVIAEAASTTEIITDWLAQMGQTLTPEIATPLLAGLVTDTLGFRTSNVKARTLEVAGVLMGTGAPLYDIIQRTLNNKDYRDIQLWQRVLPGVMMEGGLIWGAVRFADIRAAHLDDPTDSGLVGYLIATEEAKVAVVFKERADGRVDVSMRSKPGYDVSEVAVALGGGGHKQAAGASLDGDMEAAQAHVLPLLRAVAAG
jgi:phosphoesterase RecJ-like protein